MRNAALDARGTGLRARRQSRPTRRGNGGFSLLELAFSIALIGVFIGLLLSRMLYYQEAAEKAVMELEANTLKLALQVHIGDLIARNEVLDYARVARENPMRWLDQPVVGYRGEFDRAVPADLPKGSWYFDRSNAELVYLVNLDRNFRPVSGAPTRVRWRVKTVRPEGVAAKDDTVIGLRLVPVEPYRWF
jgi:type II secretory pathway pseudopilin PulG